MVRQGSSHQIIHIPPVDMVPARLALRPEGKKGRWKLEDQLPSQCFQESYLRPPTY